MKKPILFIFLACLVILYACQSDFDGDQRESRTNNSAITTPNKKNQKLITKHP